jgi:hypothetical protein
MQAFVCEGTDNGVETSLRGTKQSLNCTELLYRAQTRSWPREGQSLLSPQK